MAFPRGPFRFDLVFLSAELFLGVSFSGGLDACVLHRSGIFSFVSQVDDVYRGGLQSLAFFSSRVPTLEGEGASGLAYYGLFFLVVKVVAYPLCAWAGRR